MKITTKTLRREGFVLQEIAYDVVDIKFLFKLCDSASQRLKNYSVFKNLIILTQIILTF